MSLRSVFAVFTIFFIGIPMAQAYEFSFVYGHVLKSEAVMKEEVSAQLEKLNQQILIPLGMRASLNSVEEVFDQHHFKGVVEGQGCMPSLTYFQAISIVQNYPIGVDPHVIQGIGIQWPANSIANALPSLSRSLILVPLCLKQK